MKRVLILFVFVLLLPFATASDDYANLSPKPTEEIATQVVLETTEDVIENTPEVIETTNVEETRNVKKNYEKGDLYINAYIKKDSAEVKVNICGEKARLMLPVTDKEEIVAETANILGLTEEQVLLIIKFI